MTISLPFQLLFLLCGALSLLSCGERLLGEEGELGPFQVRASGAVEVLLPDAPTPSAAPWASGSPREGLWETHPLAQTLWEALQGHEGASLLPVIRVPLSAPPLITPLLEAMQNESVLDDPISLIPIDLDDPQFGQPVPLDFSYPDPGEWAGVQLNQGDGKPAFGRSPALWGGSSMPLEALLAPGSVSLLWASHGEPPSASELTGAGDLDGDLEVDRPATRDGIPSEGLKAAEQLLPVYDPDERSLLFRPLVPLSPGRRYAVFLTRDLRSLAGDPLRSPFGLPFYPEEAELLRDRLQRLTALGLREEGLAFAWSFQTGEPSRGWRRLRAALTGSPVPESRVAGEEALLSDRERARWEALKPRLSRLDSWWSEESARACDERGGGACRRGDMLPEAIDGAGAGALAVTLAAREGAGEAALDALTESYRFVDRLVSGQLEGWQLSGDRATLASLELSELSASSATLPFWCSVPKALRWASAEQGVQRHEPPFSTLIWVPPLDQGRRALLPLAGHLARYGVAACVVLSPDQRELDLGVLDGLAQRWREGPWSLERLSALSATRRSGAQGDYPWLSVEGELAEFNALFTLFQFRRWLSSSAPEERDWDQDGTAELGGEAPIQIGGVGWGGNLALLAGALDPVLEGIAAVDPALRGAQLALESAATRWQRAGLLRLLGPLLLGEALDSGGYQLSWLLPDEPPPLSVPARLIDPQKSGWRREVIGEYQLPAGGVIQLSNPLSPALPPRRARIRPEGFILSIGARAGEQLILGLEETDGAAARVNAELLERPLSAPHSGWGIAPQSVALRQLQQLRARLWEPLDASVLAARFLDEPFDHSTEHLGSSLQRGVLLVAHLGNAEVPAAASLNLARGLSLFDGEGTLGISPEAFLWASGSYEARGALLRWPDGADGLAPFDVEGTSALERLDGRLEQSAALRFNRCSEERCAVLRLPLGPFAGGWPSAQPEGSLAAVEINQLGRFLLRRGAFSPGELEEPCLRYLSPSLRSCPSAPAAPEE